jgi:hypothetical protein
LADVCRLIFLKKSVGTYELFAGMHTSWKMVLVLVTDVHHYSLIYVCCGVQDIHLKMELKVL